jgi:acetamidase/formamidase/AraC-like DNA-binding protein
LLNSAFFTTESYPAHQRLNAWRGTLERLSLHVRKMAPDGAVHGTVSSAVSPHGMTFANISSGPQELSYQDANRNGAICLTLHLEGEAMLVDEARQTSIDSGDIVFGPTGATGGLSLQSDFRQLLVTIPRESFRSRLPTPMSLKVGRLAGDRGIGHVFSGMLESVADRIDQITAAQLRPIEIALSEFLVSNLADADYAPPAAGSGIARTQTSILHRISQHIEMRLTDPDLGVDKVAEHIGVSTRYLQKLFESAGETFTHYVRLRRLERCRADLVNPLFAHLSIGDICFRWSFNDAAHFSRAFREQYHISPRAYRREVGSTISKKVLLHTGRSWPGGPRAPSPSPSLSPSPAPARPIQRSPQVPPLPPGLRHHQLPISASSVYSPKRGSPRRALIEVASGDVITIETLSPNARHDVERMVRGDGGMERALSAADARAVTGPVAVRNAQPGDLVELRIIDVRFRPSASPDYRGRLFGCQVGCETLTVTIYEFNQNESCGVARAIRQVGGKQEILRRLQIPLRAHFGLIALAASQEPIYDPMGDVCAGKGATLFLPVRVAGAMLSIGEPRAASGIECSLTGVFQILLHKHSPLNCALLETNEEWVLAADTDDSSTLDRSIAQLHRRMAQVLVAKTGLSDEEASAVVSVAVDVEVKRIDGIWRVRAALKKALLLDKASHAERANG